MATVHIRRDRRTWGWYNSPGSYEVTKRYGLLTHSLAFSLGEVMLTLFKLDGRKGPQFLRVHSGDVIPETDHLAAALMKECSSAECPIKPRKGKQPVGVIIAELQTCLDDNMELRPNPTRWDSPVIIVSAGTCAMCAATVDWYSFSSILLGIIANSVSCFLIGSVKLKFMRPRLAGESDQEKSTSCTPKLRRVSGVRTTPVNIVLLKGREDAAMAVARGKFVFPSSSSGRNSYRSIAACSILLIQFIAQLRLIPQGSLFGQIMFVASLSVSWCYNLLLCSLDMSGVQQQILLETMLKLGGDDVKRYPLENWPAMVAFVLLTLILEDDEVSERELHAVFDVLVSDVWVIWKRVVLKQLLSKLQGSESPSAKDIDGVMDLGVSDEDMNKLSKEDRFKLDALLNEARSGIETYKTNPYIHRTAQTSHGTITYS